MQEEVKDAGLIPGLRLYPAVGNDNSLPYSCLGNSMDRGAWWATVHAVTKSWTRLATKQQQQQPSTLLDAGVRTGNTRFGSQSS